MFDLKPISTDSIPTALQRADRYRLINDPSSAESICLDVLEIDPENQQALVTLVLAITDQFGEEPAAGARRAQDVLPRLRDEYKRAYYTGIVCERHAKAQLRRGGLGSSEIAYDWFRQAMSWYEKAEARRPPGNDESILRWNTCARMLARNEHLTPRPEEAVEPSLE
jgi:hypothetical protein